MIQRLQEGDKLIVTKLDWLARNTKEGIEIIKQLFARNVKVHVQNVGLLENTTMGRFFLQTLLVVAEMERNILIGGISTKRGYYKLSKFQQKNSNSYLFKSQKFYAKSTFLAFSVTRNFIYYLLKK